MKDPPVYPHFELWPAMNQPRMAPFPKPSSRLTHSELHAMVMMETIGSTGSFRSLAEGFMQCSTKLPKSHYDLHREVFPSDADFYAPSGSINVHPASELIGSNRFDARLRRSGLRPPSARLGLPQKGLTTPPTSGSRLSSAFESIPTLGFESGALSPLRMSSVKTSPVKRSLLARPLSQGVAEQRSSLPAGSTLMKSSSVAIPGSAANFGHDRLDRSHSLPTTTKPVPRRRESIVLQRVKAYNACMLLCLSQSYFSDTLPRSSGRYHIIDGDPFSASCAASTAFTDGHTNPKGFGPFEISICMIAPLNTPF